MKSKHFPDLISRTSTKRAEFLPVEWRTSLRLDGGVVDSITPQKLKGLRWVLNSTGMDVLYYTSPLHRSEVKNSLSLIFHQKFITSVIAQSNLIVSFTQFVQVVGVSL